MSFNVTNKNLNKNNNYLKLKRLKLITQTDQSKGLLFLFHQ